MSKLLLIEDQRTAAIYLSKGLSEEGMMVELAGNGPDGLH
jgi:two-component system copper resistance phosphate regulon response regulator CusR